MKSSTIGWRLFWLIPLITMGIAWGATQPRSPFTPFPVKACSLQDSGITDWQLQGWLRSHTHQQVVLFHPHLGRHIFQPRQQILGFFWQVQRIERHQVVLQSLPPCLTQERILILRRNKDDAPSI